MQYKIIPERLSEVMSLEILKGGHDSFEDGACAMEIVSYIAGESHSDHPQCACPVVSAFMRSWNDSLPTEADRDRLLKPMLADLVGSKSTEAVEQRRSYMALDWLIRVHTPKFLDLVPSLSEYAKSLRDLEEIMDLAGAIAAGEKTSAALDAARAAARAAAGDAALDAARAAARAAAWAAARAAAGAAAWAAARAAAGDAALDAAGKKLQPTVQWLQSSAVDLVRRMLAAQP